MGIFAQWHDALAEDPQESAESVGSWSLNAMIAAPQGHPILRYTESGIAGEELMERAEALAWQMREVAPEEIRGMLRKSEGNE